MKSDANFYDNELDFDYLLNFNREVDIEEDENLRIESLENIKLKIIEDQLKTKIDDAFLTRFLRAKRFNVDSAYILLKNYEQFKLAHGKQWLHLNQSTIRNVLSSGVLNILNGRDGNNRRVFWLRAGLWNPRKFTADCVLQVGGVLGEAALLEATVQASGVIAIFDMENFGLSHLKHVSPAFARKMVHYLSNCLPIRIHSVHIIKESAAFALLFSIFKRFIDERTKKRIFFHGHNMESLSECITKKILPKELGGHGGQSLNQWIRLLEDKRMIQELHTVGYDILDDLNEIL